MGFNAHRGTVGHTIGASIIGKDSGNSSKPPSGGGKLSHLSVDFADNGGVSVKHRLKPTSSKQDEYSPSLEQTHMFRDAQEAHHHIGALLGVRMASGQQKD